MSVDNVNLPSLSQPQPNSGSFSQSTEHLVEIAQELSSTPPDALTVPILQMLQCLHSEQALMHQDPVDEHHPAFQHLQNLLLADTEEAARTALVELESHLSGEYQFNFKVVSDTGIAREYEVFLAIDGVNKTDHLVFTSFSEEHLDEDEIDGGDAAKTPLLTSKEQSDHSLLKTLFTKANYPKLVSFNYHNTTTFFKTLIGDQYHESYRILVMRDCQLTQLRKTAAKGDLPQCKMILTQITELPMKTRITPDPSWAEKRLSGMPNSHQKNEMIAHSLKALQFFYKQDQKYNELLTQIQSEARALLAKLPATPDENPLQTSV